MQSKVRLLLVINPPTKPTGCGCLAGSAPVEDWMPIALHSAIASLALLIPLALPRNPITSPDDAPNAALKTPDYPP